MKALWKVHYDQACLVPLVDRGQIPACGTLRDVATTTVVKDVTCGTCKRTKAFKVGRRFVDRAFRVTPEFFYGDGTKIMRLSEDWMVTGEPARPVERK